MNDVHKTLNDVSGVAKIGSLLIVSTLLISSSLWAETRLEQGVQYHLVDGSGEQNGVLEYEVFSSEVSGQVTCDNHPEDEPVCDLELEIAQSEKNLKKLISIKSLQGFKFQIFQNKKEVFQSGSDSSFQTAGIVCLYRETGFESSVELDAAINRIVRKYLQNP